MADFKLTYATMFNPPEELHTGFDKAVEKLKKNMGQEYGMLINGKEVMADEKFDDHSPVNTDWVLAKMQKGNAKHATGSTGCGAQGFSGLESHSLAEARGTAPQSRFLD